MNEAPIELGQLRGPYGVRGWVHVESQSPDAEVLRGARTWSVAGRRMEVTALRRHGGGWVAKLAGVDDPERAQQLRGAGVAVARSDFPPLPDGEYYWVDLIGARVVNRQGECLGEVRGLRSNGVHDVLEVGADESTILVPMVAQYVDAVEPSAGLVRVDWERAWS